MTPLSIILVLISALIHSSWNFFTKRGNFPVEFFFWVFLWGTFLYLPFFYFSGLFPSLLLQAPGKLWTLSIISSLIQTLYLISLIKAYQMAELSLVYPISRSAPLFTQVWAVLLIGEILSITGVVGIGLVVVGIFIISMSGFRLTAVFHPSRQTSSRPYLFALIAAVTGSVYSVLDKVCVQMTHPVFYCWLIDLFMCIEVGLYALLQKRNILLKVWGQWKKEIFLIALLQNASYLLVLVAMQMSKVSYVVAFRQVSALFGAGLGILYLKETQWKTRITGALILTIGLILVGLAK
ncbi:MAG: hypothetical protein A2V86_10345 [Deltaproteobacteria bacterium RBG_16_49_23]|nr:MAG: hypothetical protein A2V86_10345 [Deltaproteobacteria bacterium RBG_16_49_23]